MDGRPVRIHLLQHQNNFIELFCYFVNKMKHKNLVHVNFLLSDDIDIPPIDVPYTRKVYGGSSNYCSKIPETIESTTSPYSIKVNHDCFVNNHTLDFMVGNRHILDDNNNMMMIPLISNGIPHFEEFCQCYLNWVQLDEIYRLVLQTRFHPHSNGTDLTPLNQFTCDYQGKDWRYRAFYTYMTEVNWRFKDFHPIRCNYVAQKRLQEMCLENIDRFFKEPLMYLNEVYQPFICNGVFAIRTDIWKQTTEEYPMVQFSADEWGLNKHRIVNNKKAYFISNGFCIHTYDGIIGSHEARQQGFGISAEQFKQEEEDFYHQILDIAKNEYSH